MAKGVSFETLPLTAKELADMILAKEDQNYDE